MWRVAADVGGTVSGPTTHKTSWLCRDDMDRERLLDMGKRLQGLRKIAFGLLGAALIASGPSVGWWTLLPLIAAAIAFRLGDRGLDDAPRPEFRLAAAWMFAQVMIATSVALTGGAESAAVAWLAIPVVTLPARFSGRGLIAGVAFTATLMLIVTVGIDTSTVLHHPEYLAFPIALLGAVALLSSALMHSDMEHRSESIIDPLTTMLNRKALGSRVEELAQQAAITTEPIGVVVGDLDHFKTVNDEHGHATGDAVLQDVAYRLRKTLRAFDLAYRIGGEEFLVLLPGADIAHAHEVAERLRAAVEESPVAGLSLSMSFGVTASDGRAFDFEQLMADADAALYEAKRAGRNRTCVAGSAELAAA